MTRVKVSVQEEICISGGEMRLWVFTAVEDLADATNLVPLCSCDRNKDISPEVLCQKCCA